MNRQQVAAWQAAVDYGDICDTCGLSSYGIRKFQEHGFNVKPCNHCPQSHKELLDDSGNVQKVRHVPVQKESVGRGRSLLSP